jgi:hypothetical protein
MVPLEVDDGIEVEDLEEVEAQAVGVGHREEREDHKQLLLLTWEGMNTCFFSFWKEPLKRENTELIRKREVESSRTKVIEYKIATRIEKLCWIN